MLEENSLIVDERSLLLGWTYQIFNTSFEFLANELHIIEKEKKPTNDKDVGNAKTIDILINSVHLNKTQSIKLH